MKDKIINCPYCSTGKLIVEENVRLIGSYMIVCEGCGATWIDEEDAEALVGGFEQ